MFSEYLAPHLARHGFAGHYTNKQGSVREGAAMLWRASKWGVAALRDVRLRVSAEGPAATRGAACHQPPCAAWTAAGCWACCDC